MVRRDLLVMLVSLVLLVDQDLSDPKDPKAQPALLVLLAKKDPRLSCMIEKSLVSNSDEIKMYQIHPV